MLSSSSSAHSAANSDTTTKAGTGTWNGPAPKGFAATAGSSASAPPAGAAQEPQPSSVRLADGHHMPMVGLGTAGIADVSLQVALEQGYRSLDCASVYGNQAAVGAALTAWVASGAGTRDQLFITSKLGSEDHRPERVRAACEKTLADLKCQYLDLYLMHWPDAFVPGADNDVFGTVTIDHTVTIAQTWAAMEALVDEGLVRSLGISNFSVKQLEDLLAVCRIPPQVNQVELHPLLPQRKLVGVCFRKGVQCVAYSPLGGGGFFAVNDLLIHPVVAQVAQLTGCSNAQVLLKWNMQRGVPVIPKASSPAHLQDNLCDIFSWSLTSQQEAMLDALECGKRFCSPPWKDWGNPEEGGPSKMSNLLAAEATEASKPAS
ncbi:NADP-dependent oxidoreductase domain-containing protein [Haematococcus lacustris]